MDLLCTLILYNADEYFDIIKKNIDIIMKNKGTKLLLIDNGNSDAFCKKLVEFVDNENIFYKKENQNIGPGGGFNDSMKIAIRKGYQYIYFIDQDSVINSQTINELKKEIKKNTQPFSFLASAVMTEDNKTLYYFRNKLSSDMSAYSIPKRIYTQEMKYEFNAGGYTGLLINLDIVEKNNVYINEKMIIDYDDYDFTYRLSLCEPGYLIPKSKILHPMKLTTSNLILRQWVRNYTLLAQINNNDFRRKQMRINYLYMIEHYSTNLFFKSIKLQLAKAPFFSRIISGLKRA